MPPDRPADVLADLRDRIRGIEGVRDRGERERGVSTGFSALDRLLADGGLRSGTLVEWRGPAGGGALSLALAVAAQLTRADGALVVIDAGRDFYPVGAAGLGVSLDRTVVVRPDDPAAAQWAWEESLRAPGVAVTFGRVGALDDRAARRLQLAAEAGGGWGFLVPPPGRSGATWAATRIEVSPRPGGEFGRRLRVRVTRGQAGARAEAEVELAHEASPVPVAPELARPVARRRRPRR
jgi:protein ImuA